MVAGPGETRCRAHVREAGSSTCPGPAAAGALDARGTTAQAPRRGAEPGRTASRMRGGGSRPHARWRLAPACAVGALRDAERSGQALRMRAPSARCRLSVPGQSAPAGGLTVSCVATLGTSGRGCGPPGAKPRGKPRGRRRAGVPSPRASSRPGESAGSASRQAQGQTAGRAWGRPAGASCRWVQLLGGVTELSLLQFPP